MHFTDAELVYIRPTVFIYTVQWRFSWPRPVVA